MRWEDAHRSAMLAAAHAHKDFELDPTRRIDVFGVIEAADLVLGFEPMPTLSGAYYAGSGVLINANHPLARQRYTAAHEFGHHRYAHATSIDPLVEPLARWGGSTRWPPHEKQAEAFAAWFLMPRQLVIASLEELDIVKPTAPEDVYALALRMGTSYEATARHLLNLRLASSSQVDRWLSTPLASVKVGLAAGAPPESLRNDVWRLDERDNNAELAVRAGDRLVIELVDVPSSGYVWQPAEVEKERIIVDTFLDRADAADEEVDGIAVPHVFVIDIADDSRPSSDTLGFERIRPWTSESVGSYRLTLDVQTPRFGVSEDLLRIAA